MESMRLRQTEMTLLVTPDLSNFGGNMHGGELLKLLDKVAIDDEGRPVTIKAFTPSTEQEHIRWEAAVVRRNKRLGR